MYRIKPPAVYAHESVMNHPTYRARVERVVASLQEPMPVQVYTDADLPRLIRDEGLLANRKPMNTLAEVSDPILLFNTFRFDDEAGATRLVDSLADAGLSRNTALAGTGAFTWFEVNLDANPAPRDRVCRPCWRIHLQNGCLHKCTYCGLGGLLIAAVNVEDYCTHLGTLIERHPWQTTYLLDDDADPPGLEPELGCLGYLMEYFGTLDSRYLIVHTKTWNTEWVRDVAHNGNTIFVWSVSGPTQSRRIEPDAGTTEERIEAARVAQEAGIQIRYKFKPIVPVRNWREDAAETIRMLFDRTRPDVISLCCWMWNDVDGMKKKLPVELLDPDCVEAAEDNQEEMRGDMTGPFPDHVRREIYEFHIDQIRRYDRDVPISLSTENYRMWATLKVKLGCTPTNYVCGCGPQSVPGLKRLSCHPFRVAERNDAGIPCVTSRRAMRRK